MQCVGFIFLFQAFAGKRAATAGAAKRASLSRVSRVAGLPEFVAAACCRSQRARKNLRERRALVRLAAAQTDATLRRPGAAEAFLEAARFAGGGDDESAAAAAAAGHGWAPSRAVLERAMRRFLVDRAVRRCEAQEAARARAEYRARDGNAPLCDDGELQLLLLPYAEGTGRSLWPQAAAPVEEAAPERQAVEDAGEDDDTGALDDPADNPAMPWLVYEEPNFVLKKTAAAVQIFTAAPDDRKAARRGRCFRAVVVDELLRVYKAGPQYCRELS